MENPPTSQPQSPASSASAGGAQGVDPASYQALMAIFNSISNNSLDFSAVPSLQDNARVRELVLTPPTDSTGTLGGMSALNALRADLLFVSELLFLIKKNDGAYPSVETRNQLLEKCRSLLQVQDKLPPVERRTNLWWNNTLRNWKNRCDKGKRILADPELAKGRRKDWQDKAPFLEVMEPMLQEILDAKTNSKRSATGLSGSNKRRRVAAKELSGAECFSALTSTSEAYAALAGTLGGLKDMPGCYESAIKMMSSLTEAHALAVEKFKEVFGPSADGMDFQEDEDEDGGEEEGGGGDGREERV